MAVLVRYRAGAAPAWGYLDGQVVRCVEGSVYGEWAPGEVVGTADELQFLPPCEPTTVVALGHNYKDLVGPMERYDEPIVFVKSPTCVVGDADPVVLPTWVGRVWVEVELACVIRTAAFCATPDEAAACILGYTLANDVTAENVHGRDHHLARSKSLNTFCPVGRFLHTEIPTGNLRLTTRVNGRVTQRGTTADRILDDVESVMLVSRLMRLQPGDLILTGTPAGAMDSVVKPGDALELEIEGLGRLTNRIDSRM